MTGRREIAVAAVVCALGALLLLLSAGRTWTRAAGVAGGTSGDSLVGGLTAVGLLGLAALAALVATRGLARSLAGFVVGALAAIEAARTLNTAGPGELTWWHWVGFAGAALLAVGGGLAAVRGRRWPAIGARYAAEDERPRPTDPAATMWAALDRGEDPTGDPEQ